MRVGRRAANFGVRITRQPKGVSVSPRIVYAGDENRLTGVPSLPVDINPYRDTHGQPRPVVATNRPSAGAYDVVFETRVPRRRRAVLVPSLDRRQDAPRVRLLTPTARGQVVLSVADGGSGIDPRSIVVAIDGQRVVFKLSSTGLRVPLEGISRGTHRLR